MRLIVETWKTIERGESGYLSVVSSKHHMFLHTVNQAWGEH